VPVESRRRGANGAVILAAVPVIGLAGGYLGAEMKLASLRDALATRPPVAIADVASALEGLPASEADAAIARFKETAARLAERGVLVLHAQAVAAAPDDAYLRLPGAAP
jgi:hypothetical protein